MRKSWLKIICTLLAAFCAFAFVGCGDDKPSEKNKYSITYELVGGVLGENAITEYSPSDSPIDLPTATKTGYDFKGWQEGTSDPITKLAAGTTGDKVLTAVWQAKNYTVTFDYGEGAGSESSRSVHYDEVLTSLPTPTTVPVGKKHSGWETEDGASFSVGTAYKFDKNITLFAEYSLEDYVIIYDLDGGNPWETSVITSYSWSEQDINLPTPTKGGYEFKGWQEGTADPITKLVAGTTGNKNLTAVWQAITYTITFDNTSPSDLTAWADNTTGAKPVPVQYGGYIAVPQIKNDIMTTAQKNNDDYKFKYWYYEVNNGTKVVKVAVDLTKPFTEEFFNIAEKNLTLKVYVSAQWTPFY